MPKKSRKGRLKQKRQFVPQSIGVNETTLPIQPVSPPNKQSSQAKAQVSIDELATHHQYARTDLKRSLITGGSIFSLLVVLYFILH
jgi:hypothetical protein